MFPSAVPAIFWLQKAALQSGRPVASGRFMAWDEFKAETLAVQFPDREAAGKAARTIFSGALLRENAAGSTPFLRDFINPKHADSWEPFVPALAKLLPGLDSLCRRLEEHPQKASLLDDPWFRDLLLIRNRYEAFLISHRLYEAAWNRTAFNDAGRRWLLFFPELAEDWEEYRDELEGLDAGILTIIDAPHIAAPKRGPAEEAVQRLVGGGLIRFKSAAAEFRWLALTVRKLLEEGCLAPEDIAVSFPGIDANAERLLHEFRLRDVPAFLRGGKPLSDYGGGRIFSNLADCAASQWSYRALKNLLLDRAYPWKHGEKINALLEFGRRYRCVSGFQGRDVWEETFTYLGDYEGSFSVPVSSIKDFYTRLKRDIQGILEAKNFSALREQWHIFENRYFDRNRIDTQTDQIIARAMRALDELASAAERFSDTGTVLPAFGLFRSFLRETEYVFQPPAAAIPVYDYKVAAGIEPALHFIINASQDAASVLAGAAGLREDRKALLALKDRDLSGSFAAVYACSGRVTVFSVSEKTYSGPAVPLRCLSALGLKELEEDGADEAAVVFPAEPAYTAVRRLEQEQVRPLRATAGDMRIKALPFPALNEELSLAISRRKRKREGDAKDERDAADNVKRLSPTDLEEYLACPFRWMLERGLGIREKQTDIETIDQRDLGMLYHHILEGFFMRIMEEDKLFDAGKIETYCSMLEEETDAALKAARQREGAFQESVYAMLRDRIVSALKDFLAADAENLDGAKVLKPEYPLRRDYPKCGAVLAGTADLVLEKEDSYILTDFKTNKIPQVGELIGDRETPPANVQLAAYIRMLEQEPPGTAAKKVQEARFYSLDKRQYREVVADFRLREKSGRSELPLSREAYQAEIDAVDAVLSAAAAAMENGEYPASGEAGGACGTCRLAPVCRVRFSGGELPAGRGHAKA